MSSTKPGIAGHQIDDAGQNAENKTPNRFQIIMIAHFVCGMATIVLGALELSLWHETFLKPFSIAGLPCGLLLCAAGGVALLSRKSLSKRYVISGLVLCILSLLLCLAVIGCNIFSLVIIGLFSDGGSVLMTVNVFSIVISVGGFINSCFHIHFARISLRRLPPDVDVEFTRPQESQSTK